jgi:DNA repair exonuclease SbcCD ATPase subunit
MKVHTLGLPAASFALVFAAACGRNEPTRTADVQTEQRQEIEERAVHMEQRVSELERKLSEMTAKPEEQRAVSANRVGDIREDLNELRQEIADLRTTEPQNWWDRTERSVERAWNDVQSDARGRGVTARAPTETEGTADREATPPVAGQDLSARREQFVNRMESDIKALEQELDKLDRAGRNVANVDDVRDELKDLKEEVASLRTANENDWWDITKKRLDRTADRIERQIDKLDDDATPITGRQ